MARTPQPPLTPLVTELQEAGLAGWLDQPVASRFPSWRQGLRHGRRGAVGPRATLGELVAASAHLPSWRTPGMLAEARTAIAAELTRRRAGLPEAGLPGWGRHLDRHAVAWLGLRRAVGFSAEFSDPSATIVEVLERPIPTGHTRKAAAQRTLARVVLDEAAACQAPIAGATPRSPLARQTRDQLLARAALCRFQLVRLRAVTPTADSQRLVVDLLGPGCFGGQARGIVHFEGDAVRVEACGHDWPCGVELSALHHAALWLDTPAGRAFGGRRERPAWQNALETLAILGKEDALTAVVELEGGGRILLRDPSGRQSPIGEWWSARTGIEGDLAKAGTFGGKLAVLASYPRVVSRGRPVKVAVEALAVRLVRRESAIHLEFAAGGWTGDGRALSALPTWSGMALLPSAADELHFVATAVVPPAIRAFASTPFPEHALGDLLTGLTRLGLPVERGSGLVPVAREWPLRLVADLSFEPGHGLFGVLRVALWGDTTAVAGNGDRSAVISEEDSFAEVTRDVDAERARVGGLFAALGLGSGDGIPLEPDSFVLGRFDAAVAAVRALGAEPDVTLRWRKPLRLKAVAASSVRVSLRPIGAWLEIGGEVADGGPPLAELLAAIRARKELVVLGSGEVLEIARPLFDQLGHLAELADLEAGKLRIGRVHQRQLAADLAERLVAVPDDFREPDEVDVPGSLRAELRPYQVEGFRFAARRAAWAPGAVLADDMGLGKTVQAIALLCARPGPALVVAPTSVAPNWIAELRRFAPHLALVDHRGTNRSRVVAPKPGEIVITSWDTLVRDEELLADVRWDVVVLDEAHAVKNPRTRRAASASALDAAFRLALTGTPVENRLSELWSLLAVVVPGLLPREDLFRARFQIPIERDHDAAALERLRRVVHPFLLRRTKGEVAAFLPPKTEVVEHVELPLAERTAYHSIRAAAMQELATESGPQGRFRVLAAITRLRQAACDVRLVEPKRTSVGPKVARLVELAVELAEEGVKTLVFSEFTSLLDLCEPALEKAGLGFLRLDGSMPPSERTRRVAAFQAGEAPVFLLSRKAGGTGLNLTAATAVIHLDPWWNPAVEDQATDRAHRIGQDKPITVIRLVASDTLEERVLALHAEKRALVAGVLEGTSASRLLEARELLALLADDPAPKKVDPATRAVPTVLARMRTGVVKLAKVKDLKPSTVETYRAHVEAFIAWLEADPDEIDTRRAIDAYLAETGGTKGVAAALNKAHMLSVGPSWG